MGFCRFLGCSLEGERWEGVLQGHVDMFSSMMLCLCLVMFSRFVVCGQVCWVKGARMLFFWH